MYCVYQGKAQGHHFVREVTIQGSHIHTTFDLTGKTVTLLVVTLSHSTTKVATGDGPTTAFTINANRTVDDVLVFVNGINEFQQMTIQFQEQL